MKKLSTPKSPKFSVEPYLFIFDLALECGGVNARQVAEELGVSIPAARMRLYRMSWVGALDVEYCYPITYFPKDAGGSRKLIEIARRKSIKWVDMQAKTSPPGMGAML